MTEPLGNLVMMFHIGRSGSRVLGDLLQQHPALHWDHEAFVHQLQAARRAGLTKPGGNPIDLLKQRLLLASGEANYGTEVKFFHLRLFGYTLAEFVAEAAVLGFRQFVLLKRQNYLRKIVSSLVGQQTKRWHQRQHESAVLSPIRVDVNRVNIDWVERPLLDHLYQFEADFAEAAAVLRPFAPLNLNYETDVLPDPQIGYGKLCQFLGLPLVPGEVRYGRSNPYPLRHLVQNFDELAKTVQNSPFEWMVQEDSEQEFL